MTHFISVQRMLFDNVVEDLKRNKLLRELAKPNEIIWQQMKFEHFQDFLRQGLYFKRYDKLIADNENQERKFQEYNDVDDYSENLYISSWYNAEQLSNIVFKNYSKSGVAIGFKIKDIKTVFEKEENNIIYMGNVQYLSDNYLDSEKRKIFSKYQKIAPVFMKPMHCSADKEFRICKEIKEDKSNGKLNDTKYCLNVVNDLINYEFYIATDGTITDKEINDCLEKAFYSKYVNKRLVVEKASEKRLDGFSVYKIRKR